MVNVLLRWSIPLAALFVLGPIAALLTYSLRAADGGGQTSLLLNTSISSGLIAGGVALAMALAIGVLGARFIEQRSGLLAAGFVLAWAAFGAGRLDRLLAVTRSEASLYTLAIEAALLGVAGAVMAQIILRVPTRVPQFLAASDTTRNLAAKSHHEPIELRDPRLPLALLAAALGAVVGVWLVAQDFTKGQTFAAVTAGGVLAAAFGRLATQRATPAVFLLGVMLVGVVGPIAAMFAHPSGGGVVRAAIAGTMFPLSRPLPLDWLAGAFVGIPMGLWWAGSMLEKHAPHGSAHAAR